MRRKHKGAKWVEVETRDHRAMFIRAALSIVRGSGLLLAYRRGTGLLLLAVRTPEAEATLTHAVERLRFSTGHGTLSEAWESSGRTAMCEFLDQWWTTKLCDKPPEALGPGDEFFSQQTVAEITERGRDVTPDLRG